jgi:hypothetical protein
MKYFLLYSLGEGTWQFLTIWMPFREYLGKQLEKEQGQSGGISTKG